MHMITNRGSSESISAIPLNRGTRSRSYGRGRVCGAALCSIHGSRHRARV
jgi:hypothetical protein